MRIYLPDIRRSALGRQVSFGDLNVPGPDQYLVALLAEDVRHNGAPWQTVVAEVMVPREGEGLTVTAEITFVVQPLAVAVMVICVN